MVLDKCSVFLMKIDLMFCSILSFTECDVEPLEGRHLLNKGKTTRLHVNFTEISPCFHERPRIGHFIFFHSTWSFSIIYFHLETDC